MTFCVCTQSLEVLLRHPEDNRNQIRELAQTLMDGGVLDELIQQKVDAFNTRWDELMARVRHATLANTEICAQRRTCIRMKSWTTLAEIWKTKHVSIENDYTRTQQFSQM